MKKAIKCSTIHHQKKNFLKVGSKKFYYILVFSKFSEHLTITDVSPKNALEVNLHIKQSKRLSSP